MRVYVARKQYMHGAYGQRSVSSSCDQYMSTFLLLLRPATQGEATRRDEGDSIRAMHCTDAAADAVVLPSVVVLVSLAFPLARQKSTSIQVFNDTHALQAKAGKSSFPACSY
jgi:hypothetical protein